jgi:hypothetical protein
VSLAATELRFWFADALSGFVGTVIRDVIRAREGGSGFVGWGNLATLDILHLKQCLVALVAQVLNLLMGRI